MSKIGIVEVGPRDGWQNLKQMLTFEEKISVIDALVNAGVKEMEVTSFVSPKAIPQMADATQLAEYCLEHYPDVKFWALAPNFRGAENAYNAGIRNISYVISVSENPYSFDEENWATLYVTSGGADNPRPIKLRKKPSTGQWFLNDIQCLSDIRIPAEEDPWA